MIVIFSIHNEKCKICMSKFADTWDVEGEKTHLSYTYLMFNEP